MFMERFEELCRKNGYTPSGVMVAIGRSRSLAAKWKKENGTPSPETGDFQLLYTNGNITSDILHFVHNRLS